jgi:hypothetical protein
MIEMEAIAKVCHQANKAYCESLGDMYQTNWEHSPKWQKDSAISGVKFHLDNHDAKASDIHNSWMNEKLDAGWKWGATKDPESREHPCIIPFEELPKEQQVKDILFKAVVDALRDLVS